MTPAPGFADFVRRVGGDPALAAALRTIDERDALTAAAVAAAGRLGFAVTERDVAAAMAGNRHGWLMQTAPLPAPGEPGPVENPDPAALAGWTPFRTGWADGTLTLDWCHLGDRRPTAPFFFETIAREIGHPFNAAFQQRSRADGLAARAPGLPPAGFIFHMARCGSTLCAQMLAADPTSLVLSEPGPLRGVLEAGWIPALDPARVDAWLSGTLSALAQPRFPGEARAIVKFMAADVLDLPRLQRVFPAVPWIFLYREPLEVVASQVRQAGADTLPGRIDPARLGIDPADLFTLEPSIYQLKVIAALGRAALDDLDRAPGRGLVLRYDDLPEALFTRVLPHFGLEPDAATRAAMRAAAGRDAKAPGTAFRPDGEAKRRAMADWREAAAAIAGPVVAALDAARAR
ncbi:sulfotransferase family protein [Methylobacterium sp. JK268]